MKVEQVEPTDDEVIDLAMNKEMRMQIDGTEPPIEEGKEVVDPEATHNESQQDQDQKTEPDEPTEKDQLQAALDRIQKLERALDKTNGTYGNELSRLKGQLAEVEKKKHEIAANITPAQFKRIRDAYGDELADALIGDLTETFSAPSQDQKIDAKPEVVIDPRLEAMAQSTEQLAGQVRQMAITELTRIHPDWRTVAEWESEDVAGVGKVIRWKDSAFGAWVNKQDMDTRNTVFASDDINAVAEVLTRYKSESKPAETTNQKDAIKKKLERAVLPTGRRTGSHELLTDEEIIEQARRETQKELLTGY